MKNKSDVSNNGSCTIEIYAQKAGHLPFLLSFKFHHRDENNKLTAGKEISVDYEKHRWSKKKKKVYERDCMLVDPPPFFISRRKYLFLWFNGPFSSSCYF